MAKELITLTSGKVNEYLHLIDINAYKTNRMLSLFLGEFDEGSVLIDCGSSLDINKSLRYFKKNNIPLSTFKYLVTTHHHFDHVGGLWKIFEEIKKYNPDVKILTNNITKELLNDFNLHLKRGKRTYGDLTGIMKPIEDSAFQIIVPNVEFHNNADNLKNNFLFHSNGSEFRLVIYNTPGHTPDHQCPSFYKDGELDFIHFGEAVGTIYHASKLVTMPTSMPIFYNNEKYMDTLNNLENLKPLKAGFGHFGLVNGRDNVRKLFLEHMSYMKKFREKIIKYYQEKPETSYVLEKMTSFLYPRTDLSIDDSPVFSGIALAIVYGEMITLGYREIPEEELVYYKKFYSL